MEEASRSGKELESVRQELELHRSELSEARQRLDRTLTLL